MTMITLRRLLAAAFATTLLASCQTTPAPAAGTRSDAQILLLGEKHDNGEGHRLRAEALRARVEAGWRPAIAMEQFDREQQPALDAAMRECGDADCVVARVITAKSSWEWTFYKPIIALAMDYKLPLLAANLSRTDAGKVINDGVTVVLDAEQVSRYGLDKPVPAAVLSRQISEVRSGHCGKLPDVMLEPMSLAQVARDIVMADTMRPFASRGVVLIAGNGHVRRDIAVPYWLNAQGLATWSVGYVETAGAAGEFDEERRIPAIERPNVCDSI